MLSKLALAVFASVVCVAGLSTALTALDDYSNLCLFEELTPVSTASSTTASPTSVPSGVGDATFWFSFGDSYTQTGFNITDTVPQPGNPLGNPPYPGNTAVGGTNWIDVDTTVYNNSLILTYNYAYGGATINASLVPPFPPWASTLSLIDQVDEFMSQAASKPAFAPWTSENALFSVWIGINDIGLSFYWDGDRDAFSDTLLDSYFGQVQLLVNARSNTGARNFLFINVPPVDRSPLMALSGADVQAMEKTVIEGFNTKLSERVTAFEAAHSGVTTWQWDSNAAFTKVLDDPTAYGFVDNTSYGHTGDFWGNIYHPSSAAHTLFGQGVASVLAGTVW